MIFRDNFGNRAEITQAEITPYKDAKHKTISFVLKLFAEYDNDFLYFLSIYETLEDCLEKLKHFSCGTFKRIGV